MRRLNFSNAGEPTDEGFGLGVLGEEFRPRSLLVIAVVEAGGHGGAEEGEGSAGL